MQEGENRAEFCFSTLVASQPLQKCIRMWRKPFLDRLGSEWRGRGEKVVRGREETIYGGKALESKQSISLSLSLSLSLSFNEGEGGGGALGMSMILRWIVDRWTDGRTGRMGKSHPA